MKIKFSNGETFDVYSVHYSMGGGNNHPIDIVIYADEDILESISNHASIGVNIQPVDSWSRAYTVNLATAFAGGKLAEGLFARLEEFEVINAKTVQYDD